MVSQALELQMVVSSYVGAENQTTKPGPLEVKSASLSSEPCLQPRNAILRLWLEASSKTSTIIVVTIASRKRVRVCVYL